MLSLPGQWKVAQETALAACRAYPHSQPRTCPMHQTLRSGAPTGLNQGFNWMDVPAVWE